MVLRARIFGAVGGGAGLLGVALGAFGAHALEGRLTPGDLAVFETAVRYQMYHALALLAVSWLVQRHAPGGLVAGWAFSVGILVFSGSLYVLVLSGQRWLGAVTPVGGIAFLVGWTFLLLAFLRSRDERDPT
jgi:uncharacterized membrane protein YgdD (TMEM256/DUF423 family)